MWITFYFIFLIDLVFNWIMNYGKFLFDIPLLDTREFKIIELVVALSMLIELYAVYKHRAGLCPALC